MPLIVKSSNIEGAGNGIFTEKSYPKGCMICFYGGDCVDYASVTNNYYSICHPINNNLRRVGYKIHESNKGVGQLINGYDKLQITDDEV